MSLDTRTLHLTQRQYDVILDALFYAADDLAYRAEYEDRSGIGDADERDEYIEAADKYSRLAAELGRIREADESGICPFVLRTHDD